MSKLGLSDLKRALDARGTAARTTMETSSNPKKNPMKSAEIAPQVRRDARVFEQAHDARDDYRSAALAADDASTARHFSQTFAPLRRTATITTADRALFAKAVADVAPLRAHTPRVRHKKKTHPIPKQFIADEAAALTQANEAINPSPMSWDVGLDLEDDQSYLRTGANPDLLRKLRRGMWVVQGELDLHHHTQEEAAIALSEFIAVAQQNEWRCVRIVHGKGLSSYRKEPILRGKVRRWLQQRADIICYCEPRPNGGGSGAVLVLLG